MQRQQQTRRSIGEVLALLKQEFPEVSISKIRFLESQGLVEPERTTSGYRKFSDNDIDRLRFILTEQRENFLPLKVIRDRLDERTRRKENHSTVDVSNNNTYTGEATSPTMLLGGATLDRSELLSATGLNEGQLRELESYGIVSPRTTSDASTYDEGALVAAKLASRLLAFGIEVRHLRIYKTAAEREADLYKQLTVQVRGSRNTTAKMEAQARLNELTTLGQAMHTELVRHALSH